MYKIWFARNYEPRRNTLLLDNGLATWGRVAVCDGGRDAYPKRRVMAVCGDGGFMMNSRRWKRPCA